jgi:hypothetical protein
MSEADAIYEFLETLDTIEIVERLMLLERLKSSVT